ncbi:uncharacterized protein VICG_01630 [Vittaforma corneae ATCC 50505]|uniref:Inositol polyphosphate-related phosphatase domain-containing protein n=1 Tax=Vittaforma corneae (strain ATCC 50505) TaxID=993615 RepID=L2GL69_VITCO|nr:uncharacterized protein VICG_01630 [Vittaforma corneae ATCC 50505]ELA41389.1 hypothetical protein VICG_01630 [Vittaforma corneae ATCC 50505]
MKICTLTWNTHGGAVIPEIETHADLFIVALQECYDTPRIKCHFRYVKMCSMFGLKTLVASNDEVKTQFFRVGQGAFSFVNKGFIATKVNEQILHINAHLAPHEYNNDERLRQLEEIVKFVGSEIQTVILAGDLNFRCCPHDQADGFKRRYPQFREEKIHFKPTYKYRQNSYDLSRTPSYCDRVMVASAFRVSFDEYSSLDKITLSDHKPVICRFKVTNDRVVQQVFSGSSSSLIARRMLTAMYVLLIEERRKLLLLTVLILFIIKIALKIYKKFQNAF